MAARLRSAGIALVIGTEYNGRDLARVQNDLDKLKRKSASTSGSVKKFGSAFKGAFAGGLVGGGVGAAAGALASMASDVIQLGITFAKDGVTSALAEEKALAALERQVRATGNSFDLQAVMKFVDDLQYATNVSDSELFPALQTLTAATGSLSTAQGLLGTVIDASIASGKDLSSVTGAMSKAAQGNTSSLKRLFPALSSTALASKDLTVIQEELNRLYGGAASTALSTTQGQMENLKIAIDEAGEALGKGLLAGFLGTTTSSEDLVTALRNAQPQLETLGRTIGQLGVVLQVMVGYLVIGTSLWRGFFAAVSGNNAAMEQAVADLNAWKDATFDAGNAWESVSDQVAANPLVGVVAAVDPYGQALGLQPQRFSKVIQGIIDAAKGVQDAADHASADGASAAAEAARKLAERTKKRTDQILADLRSNIEKAKAASDEFASIRRGYVQAAREDAAITTFAPEGKITSRGIEANIRQRLGLIKRFANAIKGLRGTLNGAALSDIIAQGPIAGLPYAEALLKDTASVGRINELQAQLATPTATIGRIGAELQTGTTAAKLAAAETFTNKYVVGKDAINITVNGDITAAQRRQLKQAVRDALSDVGREGKNGKKVNIR